MFHDALLRTRQMLENAALCFREEELQRIEIATFGLESYPQSGLQLITYINSPRYCAKELVLFPRQTCPEHRHPPFAGTPGKQETFRCRWGEVYLFVDDDTLLPGDCSARDHIPQSDRPWYHATRGLLLRPGDQYTIAPNTLHWFQAGDRGAVISEFSSQSRDDLDIFSDPRVNRLAGL